MYFERRRFEARGVCNFFGLFEQSLCLCLTFLFFFIWCISFFVLWFFGCVFFSKSGCFNNMSEEFDTSVDKCDLSGAVFIFSFNRI